MQVTRRDVEELIRICDGSSSSIRGAVAEDLRNALEASGDKPNEEATASVEFYRGWMGEAAGERYAPAGEEKRRLRPDLDQSDEAALQSACVDELSNWLRRTGLRGGILHLTDGVMTRGAPGHSLVD